MRVSKRLTGGNCSRNDVIGKGTSIAVFLAWQILRASRYLPSR